MMFNSIARHWGRAYAGVSYDLREWGIGIRIGPNVYLHAFVGPFSLSLDWV